MELQALSSNWKKLQLSLQSSAPKKRKVDGDISTLNSSPPPKRSKTRSGKSPKMGLLFSKSAASTAPANTSARPSRVSLPKAPSSASLPAALTDPTLHHSTDQVNAGRTPNLNPGKFIAIDCEMVGVGPNPDLESALARVSLVDFHGAQLYDSFVQPKEAVTDYRTYVSGITPALIKNARSLEEVQRDVGKLLQGRILVGHAVRHDLDALMLGHPRRDIRDTSRYPRFRELVGGRTPGLRRLAKELLGLDIQAGEHSSVEDARATMALFRMEKDGFEEECRKRFGGGKDLTKAMARKGEHGDNTATDGDGVTENSKHRRNNKKKKKKKSKR